MEGYHDPFNRRPFPWGKEDKDLLGFYREIGKLRSLSLFQKGYMKLPEGMPQGVFALARFDESGTLFAFVNLSGKTQTLCLDEIYLSLGIGNTLPKFNALLGEKTQNRKICLKNMAFSLLFAENDTQC